MPAGSPLRIVVAFDRTVFRDTFDQEAISRLDSLGDVAYRFDLTSSTPESTYREALQATGAQVVVTCWGSPRLTADCVRRCPGLAYMCHLAGSVRPYVEPSAVHEGLTVSNWGDTASPSVAEAALMMMIAALRNTTHYQMEMHLRGGWRDNTKTEGLFFQRVGLYGFGSVARSLVRLLRPFSCTISAYDPYVPQRVFDQMNVRRVSDLEDLFRQNRVISLHAASTPSNRHIADATLLSLLEDGAVLINVARGTLVDTQALIAELSSGRIRAALDVFEEEPLQINSPLRGLENCMLTPHVGGPTSDRRVDMGRFAVENIANYVAGRPILNTITAERYDLST